MTVIVIGDQQRTTYVTADSGHGHDAEDLQDIGELDVTNAEFNTVKITAGAQLTKDAALAFTPFDANGVQIPGAIYRFGRQSDFGDATQGLLDGIEMKHELELEDQELSMQLHPSQPCLDINATKQANVDWVRITDSSDLRTILAIHDDGTIETPGWNSGSLPDGHHESLAVQPLSLYVGKCKLSEVNHQLHVEHLKVPPYIPLRLTQAPYSFTTGNINANTQRSVNDWVKLARSVLSATAGKALRIKDVFPVANSVDWNDSGVTHTHGLTSNAQTQLDALQPPVTKWSMWTLVIQVLPLGAF